MPRRPDIIPKYSLTLQVPMDLMNKLRLLLWSEAEGRVPHGGYAAFFTRLLNEHFAKLEQQSNDARATNANRTVSTTGNSQDDHS